MEDTVVVKSEEICTEVKEEPTSEEQDPLSPYPPGPMNTGELHTEFILKEEFIETEGIDLKQKAVKEESDPFNLKSAGRQCDTNGFLNSVSVVLDGRRRRNLNASRILLDDPDDDVIPSDSDISGVSDDSDGDQDWAPSSDEEDRRPATEPIQEDEKLPDIPDPVADPSAPPPAKRRNTRKRSAERKVFSWKKGDLPAQEMPVSELKPKNIEFNWLEVDFFYKMFGEENIWLLMEESNRFLQQDDNARYRQTKPILESEIRQVLGILMYISVIHMPNLNMYWEKALRNNTISSVMTRDRFKFILSFLHMSDNTMQPGPQDPNFDKLYKVRKFMNNLLVNFKEYVDYEKVLSVDEMMVPFKGQHSLKVYMKNKPKKWGIKVWALAGQSGYVYKFSVKGDNLKRRDEEPDPGVGASGQVVLDLVEDVEAGTNLFLDNNFDSPALLLKLGEQRIPAACTLRANGTEKAPLKTEKELKKEQRYMNTPCPNKIKVYKYGMGGFDRTDQLLASYRIATTSRKWYRRIFCHFTDVCVVNAFILWRKSQINAGKDGRMPLYKFKIEVAMSLMFGGQQAQPLSRHSQMFDVEVDRMRGEKGDLVGDAAVPEAVRLDNQGHYPENIATRGRTCKLKGCRRRSTFWCIKCKVYLCIKKEMNCFLLFHTVE